MKNFEFFCFSCNQYVFTFLTVFKKFEYGLRAINRADEIKKIQNAIEQKCSTPSIFGSVDGTEEDFETEIYRMVCTYHSTDEFVYYYYDINVKDLWSNYVSKLSIQAKLGSECKKE